MLVTVPCISLWQPWASLVVAGLKCIETRSWQTPWRGRLAIHAGLKFSSEIELLCDEEPFRSALVSLGKTYRDLPRGHLLGSVLLHDCTGTEDFATLKEWCGCDADRWARERQFGDYRMGRWAWLLSGAVALETPRPLTGRRMLWQIDEALVKGG